jgi:formamidopyrimidine-DNA glycosylase
VPEGLEAELYRRAAERALARPIASIAVDDRQPAAEVLRSVLPGRRFVAVRRHGKHVLVDLDPGPVGRVLGLHFGMTGRLVVDTAAAIDQLAYASGRDHPDWDRFVVRFRDGGVLRVNDPRRWGTFDLDPDLGRLGPDFLTVTADQLRPVLARRRSPVKSALLDQSVVAGYGNLCVDEVLWQAGIAPMRPCDEVDDAALDALLAVAREHLPAMLARGGSHRGTISPEVRSALPPCPRDGAPLQRGVVGGRTTVWCPDHQPR